MLNLIRLTNHMPNQIDSSNSIVYQNERYSNNSFASSNSSANNILPQKEYKCTTYSTNITTERPGFTQLELDKFSVRGSLKNYGWGEHYKDVSGRIFKSDTDDCYLARLDKPRPRPSGKGYNKYLQSPGMGLRFFKEFVANPASSEVLIVEGVFKALAAWKAGFNAIAYSGYQCAFNGSVVHQGLLNLIGKYESVRMCYDIDTKLKTQVQIEKHLIKLYHQLSFQGKKASIVQTWEKSLGKDLDEILANHGVNQLKGILSNAVALLAWDGISAKYGYNPTTTEETEYITAELIKKAVAENKIIEINAPMGAGKSFSLGGILKEYDSLGCLVISPLRALGRQITKDLRKQGIDIQYRDDVEASKNWERITCCLESVSTEGKLKIQVDGSQFVDKIIIIDEVAQVLKNLLTGSTIAKSRNQVVKLLVAMLRSAKKCIFMSADFNQLHSKIIEDLLGDSAQPHEICRYKNNKPRNTFNGYFLDSIQEGISLALAAIAEGKNVFLGIDSQKTSSTYSGGNLAELFANGEALYGLRNLPTEKILILDSVTSQTKGHEAYEVLTNGRKEILKSKSLIIASPSIEAGFSAKQEDCNTDLIIIFSMGCTSVNGIAQFSMRLRDLTIPRYFCFGGRPENNLKLGGATRVQEAQRYVASMLESIKTSTRIKDKNHLLNEGSVADVMNLSLNLECDGLNLNEHYYEMQVLENIQMSEREFYLASHLKAQGATIERVTLETAMLNIRKDLLAIKERRIEEEAQREFNAPNLTDKQVELLKEETALTHEQRDSMSKYYAQKQLKYEDVTKDDLVAKKTGKLEPEELGILAKLPVELAVFQEQERILRLQNVPLYNTAKLLEFDEAAQISQHDIIAGAKAHKITLIHELGVQKAIDYALEHGISDLWLNPDAATVINEAVANIIEHKKEWMLCFGWQWNDFSTSPIAIFKAVIAELGYEFAEKERARINKKQVTFYRKIAPNRAQKARQKRESAILEDLQGRYTKFTQTQLWVTAGRKLMTTSAAGDLLNEYDKETLLAAAKLLPRAEYALSKHSDLLMHINGFKPKVDVPVVVIDEHNVAEFKEVIQQWLQKNTPIGFDSETYENAIHKELCHVKNGKWYWSNPRTGKNQQIKPGLDQNQNQVRLLQFSDGINTYVIDLGCNDAPAIPMWMRDVWVKIIELGQKNTLIGHNIKFDTSSVRKYGLVIKHPYCTMIAAMLAFGDCGAGKVLANGYGLKSVAHNLLNLPVDKTEQFSDWGAETLTESQIQYAGKDAVLALRLKDMLDLIYENPANWGLSIFQGIDGNHANKSLLDLEMRTIYNATEMQYKGLPINKSKLQATLAKLEATKAEIEKDWEALKMPCTPQQAKKITEELNKRYWDRQHPFDPQELAEALGVDVEGTSVEFPIIDKPFNGSGKDVINDNSELPELQVLSAWRAFNTAIMQLSKVEVSALNNNGRCKTEYKPLSGTGRMACGNEHGLGTPNLQAFVKKAEGRYFGYIPANGDTPMKFWSKPSIAAAVKIRGVFALEDETLAYFSEDANASHARLAVGFGRCEFGKSVLNGMDGHSMFSMTALKCMLESDPTCIDNFAEIRDFVNPLTDDEIRSAAICKTFKQLDEARAGSRFRSAAKTLFYSVLNGAQADKMRKVMASASGSSVSIEVGTQMFDKFWNLYSGIGSFIKKVLDEAEQNSINFGGIEFNVTTLPDGVKLAYARKEGELATTNIIACQWSRAEASALKRIMNAFTEIPEVWGAELINMVHDELGATCKSEYWQESYAYISDHFAKEYDVYLQGFLPADEPTEVKLQAKLAENPEYIPTSWADK